MWCRVMGDLKEQIAITLWHRFAPEGHMEWSEEKHAAEYRDAADAVLFLARSSLGANADHTNLSQDDIDGMTIDEIADAVSR